MAIFKTGNPLPPPIPDGCYVAKILSATERPSAHGNMMIVMQLQLAGAGNIPCCLTFVNKARVAINAFCDSAELIRPTDPGIEVDLTAADCLGRYIYVTIVNDDDGEGGEPFPKIVRFLTRQAALIKNPAIAKVVLQEQKPRHLHIVSKPEFSP